MQLPLFSLENLESPFYKIFLTTHLGYIYKSIPWDELVRLFTNPIPKDSRGRKSKFSIKGGLGLMFLKHSGLSDKKLIEAVNGNWHYQYFCSVVIAYNAPDGI